MGPEERDWVDVANNVLLKCHINLRLERISECDANVFVALYEAILGEKVPDYVAAERQEDDIHNVQSVIDSLALDYLQISLSHITGENIVSGEKESVRNLLEIFDGLLDYLIEQQSDEEPQHKVLYSSPLNIPSIPGMGMNSSQQSSSDKEILLTCSWPNKKCWLLSFLKWKPLKTQ
uniref:DUF5745 domain-containing protein n=1 Tax=Cyprinus carpio carpio TaxID=630221 RepID=A0A9J7YC07_CYPCA